MPKASTIHFECPEEVHVLIAYFRIPTFNCEKLSFLTLARQAKEMPGLSWCPLPVRPPLRLFCELEVCYLSSGAGCRYLHETKLNELFFCLRFCYSREELAGLLFPVLSKDPDFHSFVMSHYREVRSVKELVERSHMSKSLFYRKFVEVFDTSAKQWLLERRQEEIFYEAAKPEATVKSLMARFEFDSLSHFQVFCKTRFGCTPTELIREARQRSLQICG